MKYRRFVFTASVTVEFCEDDLQYGPANSLEEISWEDAELSVDQSEVKLQRSHIVSGEYK